MCEFFMLNKHFTHMLLLLFNFSLWFYVFFFFVCRNTYFKISEMSKFGGLSEIIYALATEYLAKSFRFIFYYIVSVFLFVYIVSHLISSLQLFRRRPNMTCIDCDKLMFYMHHLTEKFHLFFFFTRHLSLTDFSLFLCHKILYKCEC